MEKEKKKNNKLIIILILIILLLLLFILFLMFGLDRSYTLSFDTDGGSLVSNIKIENGEIVNLPNPPTKEGYTFTGWTDEKGFLITEGTVVQSDLTLKATWIDEDAKTVKVSFKSDNLEIINVTLEKDGTILIPVNPTKDGYTFGGWLNSDGKIITESTKVNKNVTITALWIKNDVKTSTITVNTDGGNNIGSIIIENGKVITLPTNPVRAGYVFAGWIDNNGNPIKEDTIVNGNMTIKATWKQPYTCPKNCIPSDDGKTCIREVTTEKTTVMICPNGYKQISGKCLDTKNQILPETKEYCTDGSTPVNSLCVNQKREATSAYDCVGKEYYEDGYCIMTSSYANVCPNGYYKYTEIEGLGAVDWCAKKVDKVSSLGCPSGYKESGNVCKKTETVKCTKN